MSKQYDVIVVGAGNGGLVAAATAAKYGLKTLLLEKNNIPGGCATSFCRGRFEFEPSLHELAGFGSPENPGDVRQLFEKLGVDATMLPVEDAFRSIITGPGGYDVTMPTGEDAFIEAMEQHAPGSRESMTAFFELARQTDRALAYLTQSRGNPDPAIMGSEHLNFMKIANLPIDKVLDALQMPARAREILTTYWCYLGAPADMLNFIHYALMVNRYISLDPYIPKMRSHELSLALDERVRAFGGEIRYNSPVTRFLIQNGRCTGVATAQGELYAKQVISNIIPHNVFGGMVEEAQVPPAERKRANARKFGASALVLYLGVNKSPEELGVKDYSVFLSSTCDSREQFRRMHTLEENDFQIMNCLNIANPGCSPAGTSLFYSTQLYFDGSWDSVKPEAYKATKNRIAAKLIKQYEDAVGVKLTGHIEELSVAAPPTFARYLGTPQGSIYGYMGQTWDGMLPRTMAMGMEQSIQGLRFCGGHATRLDGYSSSYQTGETMASLAALDIKEGR